jgi:TonB family protein
VRAARSTELNEPVRPLLMEVPEPGSPASKGFRPPVPYRRIKPEYTRLAYLYDVTATVDVEVDLDDSGRITRTEIKRWAGFGLDESVINAVKAMNWMPATRGGKPLPMRILLRYNFKKIDSEQIAQ